MPEPESGESDVPQFETFAVVEDERSKLRRCTDEFETNAARIDVQRSDASFADLNEDDRLQLQLPIFRKSTSASSHPDTPALLLKSACDEERHENVMRQELESVDFYIAQGYSDIAVDTLEMLERQFGPHPEIQSRREKLTQRDQPRKRRRCLSLVV
jgi:hypothetical protein